MSKKSSGQQDPPDNDDNSSNDPVFQRYKRIQVYEHHFNDNHGLKAAGPGHCFCLRSDPAGRG